MSARVRKRKGVDEQPIKEEEGEMQSAVAPLAPLAPQAAPQADTGAAGEALAAADPTVRPQRVSSRRARPSTRGDAYARAYDAEKDSR